MAAQYALGKLQLSEDAEVRDTELGIQWLGYAASNGSDCAAYKLGKEYLSARSELQRMVKRAAECEAKLTEILNDEEKHTLNVLMSAQQEIDGITAIENFISGFRLGVRLMVDCMDDDDGNIKDGR